jgi:hypothetical protein
MRRDLPTQGVTENDVRFAISAWAAGMIVLVIAGVFEREIRGR